MNVGSLKSSTSWFLSILIFSATSLSADPDFDGEAKEALMGKPVLEVLDTYLKQGLKLLYSTDYIPPALLVLSEPKNRDPLKLIDEILKPYALKLKEIDGSYVVVKVMQDTPEKPSASLLIAIRSPPALSSLEGLVLTIKPEIARREKLGSGLYEFFPSKPGVYSVEIRLPGYRVNRSTIQLDGNDTKLLSVELELGPAELEDLSVSASRYVLFSSSQFVIDQKALQALPSVGDDPVKSVHRLQGSAAGGFSARSHFRGGAVNETSIYLNGVKLVEPFHIRDFQSMFSSIDAQAISSVQVYTGGFPAEYGDDMSGVLMLTSKQPQEPLHTELGLSVFYTSILNSGYSKEGRYDWLVSARRSNLSLVLAPDIGDPKYFDIFTTLGFNPSPQARISLNALLTDDGVTIFAESDPSELEKTVSESSNRTVWLTVDNFLGDNLSVSTTFSGSKFSNRRTASVNDPEQMIGEVSDNRNIEIYGIRSLIKYEGLDRHLLKWGLEFNRQKAKYDYLGKAEYFSLVGGYPGLENPVSNQVKANPVGNSYAVFLSDRFSVNDQLSFELGLRWDKQTYTDPNYSSQLSPRASVRYGPGNNKIFRFTIGRYYQSQPIQELQVEDNIDRFFKPQYADHVIASYQWATSKDYEFRVEAYYKKYGQLAPRFENLFDPLQLLPELQPDRVRLDPQSASARGVEFSVEHDASKTFSWWASYTYSRVTDTIDGYAQRRSWDQLHAFQFGLGWQRDAWEFGFATRIRSGWPTTGLKLEFGNEFDEPSLVPGPRNAEQLGVFVSLDFRISRRFDVRVGKLTGFLEATNSTNRKNPCCVDYGVEKDLDGNIFLHRKIEYWLPIIPSIGLLWEF